MSTTATPGTGSQEQIYGFYSEKHAHIAGTLDWLDDSGNIVTITGCTDNAEGIGYGWSDAQLKGRVMRMVRRHPATDQCYGPPAAGVADRVSWLQ